MASRTLHVELHAPARLRNLPGAAAFRALARCFNESVSVTVAASVAVGDIQAHDATANRRPEGNAHLVFEIAPRFGDRIGPRPAPASAKHAGENIAKPAATAAFTGTTGVVH